MPPTGHSLVLRENAWTAVGLAVLSLGLALGPLQGLAPALALAGGLAAAGAAYGAARLAGVAGALERPGLLTGYGAAAFLALASTAVLTQHLGRVEGHWYAWLEDDAMVSMQYARHLAEGGGLVWTAGQRVEGFSNPAWTLLMAACVALLPRPLAALPVLGLNLALGLAYLFGVRRLARALGATPVAAAWAAVGTALSFDLVWAAASGMESVAMACAAAWAFAEVAEARAEGRAPGRRTFLLAGLLAVIRADGILATAAVLLLAWPDLRGRRGGALALALALGPSLLWLAFRLGYYGDWIPNTVRLKAGDWPGRWAQGLALVLRVPWQAPLATAFALAALGTRGLRRWGLAAVLLAAYGLLTGGDFYPGTRYLAPSWPLLWALAAAAVSARFRPGPAGWLLALAAGLSYHALWAFPGLMQGGWSASVDRIRVARALDRLPPEGKRVAAAWAGSFFYFSTAEGVDLLGKCDPVVARASPDSSLFGSGHNKMDLGHSLGGLRPDWVVALPPGSPDPAPWLHSAYDRKLWDDPLFRRHCTERQAAPSGPWLLCRCRWPNSEGSHADLRP